MNASEDLKADRLDVQCLLESLPQWLNDQSIGRAQIIRDQLHQGVSNAKTLGQPFEAACLAFVTEIPKAGQFAMLAIRNLESNHPSPGKYFSDSATVLQGSWWPNSSGGESSANVGNQEISLQAATEAIHAAFASVGINFLLWPSDPAVAPADSRQGLQPPKSLPSGGRDPKNLQISLGYRSFAILEYRCLELAFSDEVLSLAIEKNSVSNGILQLLPLKWESKNERDRFADLVNQTYTDTGDCPELNQHRTVHQTLAGYQAADSFAPDRWYWVYRASDPKQAVHQAPCGCLIMANHPGLTSELVYMGVTPEQRGKGIGKPLMALAIEETTRSSGKRALDRDEKSIAKLVLAVDEQNTAAKRLYDAAGFQTILREEVWGKGV